MWRGLSRLTDIELGFIMGAHLVDNWNPANRSSSVRLLDVALDGA